MNVRAWSASRVGKVTFIGILLPKLMTPLASVVAIIFKVLVSLLRDAYPSGRTKKELLSSTKTNSTVTNRMDTLILLDNNHLPNNLTLHTDIFVSDRQTDLVYLEVGDDYTRITINLSTDSSHSTTRNDVWRVQVAALHNERNEISCHPKAWRLRWSLRTVRLNTHKKQRKCRVGVDTSARTKVRIKKIRFCE